MLVEAARWTTWMADLATHVLKAFSSSFPSTISGGSFEWSSNCFLSKQQRVERRENVTMRMIKGRNSKQQITFNFMQVIRRCAWDRAECLRVCKRIILVRLWQALLAKKFLGKRCSTAAADRRASRTRRDLCFIIYRPKMDRLHNVFLDDCRPDVLSNYRRMQMSLLPGKPKRRTFVVTDKSPDWALNASNLVLALHCRVYSSSSTHWVVLMSLPS